MLSRVSAVSEMPNLAILAPAGYGKTTLMSQLEEAEQRTTAWLTLDEADSDPATLLWNLARSFSTAGLVGDPDQIPLAVRRSDRVITHGINELWQGFDESRPSVIFLDQVDHVATRSALDLIGATMTRHPDNLQVVVASRSGDGLPIPLLRSRSAIHELTMTDLEMNEGEVRAMLGALDGRRASDLGDILTRTEGWPVAVYLMALAMKSETGAEDAAESTTEVHGDDILFADYLEQELLARASDDVRQFLLRTSILKQFTAPLCDYVLDQPGSAEMLSRLEAESLLTVPLDRTRTWYRYHSLLRDLLLSQLERHHADEVPALRSRAADWFMDNGFPEFAIEHAIAAGDTAKFSDMAIASARPVYSAGRVNTVSHWWDWVEKSDRISELPELAAVAGFYRGLDGDAPGAELMAAHALSDESGKPRPHKELGPLALMLRSYRVASGVEQARDDARSARERLGAGSDWVHICIGQEGTALMAMEGWQAADPILAEGLLLSQAVGAHPASSYTAAQRALAAIERDDWDSAERLIVLSLDVIDRAGLDDYITSALGLSIAARVEARKGNLDQARRHLVRAASVRPRLSVAIPLGSVVSLHEMARAFVELADIAGARRVMREAAAIIALRPKLGTVLTEHDLIKQTLSALPAGTVGPSSLTKAELRILPMLVTHLTYPEMADRLYVSRHTVKAHAMSIYRKLGVSSRSDAVAKAREIGLISL